MNKGFAIILSLLVVFTFGCATTQYGDPTKDKGSAQWGPKEVKTTVSKMVGSMYDFLKNEWQGSAYIEIRKFKNNTSEHIDTKMISEEITTNLIKKRIKFIDQSLSAEALAEIEKGMTGLVDEESAIPVGMLKSPNLFLTGDINDNVRIVGGKQVQFIVVTMKLINVKTMTVEWQDQQEFLKSTNTSNITF